MGVLYSGVISLGFRFLLEFFVVVLDSWFCGFLDDWCGFGLGLPSDGLSLADLYFAAIALWFVVLGVASDFWVSGFRVLGMVLVLVGFDLLV